MAMGVRDQMRQKETEKCDKRTHKMKSSTIEWIVATAWDSIEIEMIAACSCFCFLRRVLFYFFIFRHSQTEVITSQIDYCVTYMVFFSSFMWKEMLDENNYYLANRWLFRRWVSMNESNQTKWENTTSEITMFRWIRWIYSTIRKQKNQKHMLLTVNSNQPASWTHKAIPTNYETRSDTPCHNGNGVVFQYTLQ